MFAPEVAFTDPSGRPAPWLERRLIERSKGGDVFARETLLRACERLVHWQARQLWAKGSSAPFEFADLLQVGRSAVSRAIDTFDLERSGSLGALASVSVRGEMIRHISRNSVITAPSVVQEHYAAINRVRAGAAERGEALTSEALMEEIGLTREQADLARRWRPGLASLDDPRSEQIQAQEVGAANKGLDQETLNTELGLAPKEAAYAQLVEAGFSRKERAQMLGVTPDVLRRIDRMLGERLQAAVTTQEDRPSLAAGDLEPVQMRRLRPGATAPGENAELAGEGKSIWPADEILAAFERLGTNHQARLGAYCAVAAERGPQAASAACDEIFSADGNPLPGQFHMRPFRALADELTSAVGGQRLSYKEFRDFRCAAFPVLAERHAVRLEALAGISEVDQKILEPAVILGKKKGPASRAAGMSASRYETYLPPALERLEAREKSIGARLDARARIQNIPQPKALVI